MIDWRKAIAGLAAGLLVVTAVEFTALRLLPASFWFAYRSLEAAPIAPPGGPVAMVSRLDRWRVADMLYHDTLFCDFGQGWQFYSTQQGSYMRAPKTVASRPARWNYTAHVPAQARRCKVRSAVTVQLKFGLQPAPQIIESNEFTIQGDN